MLYYAQQYATTKLNVSGGIDASQTTGIILLSVTGIDITKPGILCFGWSDPLVSGEYEYITYTSIDGSNELQGVTRGVNSTGITHANQVDVAWVLSEEHINNLNDMFTTGGDGYTQISTPSNPASGYNKLYFKSDDKLYKLNSAGTEAEVGSAGFKAILTPLSATFRATNYPQLVKNAGTNATDFTLDFDKDTDELCEWEVELPAGLTINSATLYVTFRTTVTTGSVAWSSWILSLAEGEAWDTAGTVDDFDAETVQDTAGKVCKVSKALTTTTWAAGETLHIRLYRDVSRDDAAADAKFMNAILIIS